MNEPDKRLIENESGAARKRGLPRRRGAANDRCAQDEGDPAEFRGGAISAKQVAEALEDVETFTHAASQDMRAPMRQVRAYVALILSTWPDDLPKEAAQMLQRIDGVARRMDALLKGIVDLSDVSRRTPKFGWCDLGALSASVLERLEPAGRRIALQVEPGLRARADARMMRMLLEALLGNARKFSMRVEHPAIAIGRVERDGRAWFFVRDNGVGFDMRYAERLFEPFHRMHSQREFEGIGLGLATARRIVEKHGGSIRAESEPGRGATISFTLD